MPGGELRVRCLTALFGVSRQHPAIARQDAAEDARVPRPCDTRIFLQVPRCLLTIPTCLGVWSTTGRHLWSIEQLS